MQLWIRKAAALLLAMMLLGTSAAKAEGALNLLMIGVDASQGEARGRSDTMMLARIDPQRGEVRLVSFLRDLYVTIPGHGKTRLNAAYSYGGENLLKETLRSNFGVTVDRTAVVHFAQLQQMVDDIGGIELEIQPQELPPLNDLLKERGGEPLNDAGLQRLNGTQALCYSRIRKIDNDFQRTSRQQKVIGAMLAQISTLGVWDQLELVIRHMGKIRTDVSLKDVAGLAPLMSRLGELEIHTFHVPQNGAYEDRVIDGMQVMVPVLDRCRRDVERFLSGAE